MPGVRELCVRKREEEPCKSRARVITKRSGDADSRDVIGRAEGERCRHSVCTRKKKERLMG
jgi:hypothetical protein